jgi:hypothetical protein
VGAKEGLFDKTLIRVVALAATADDMSAGAAGVLRRFRLLWLAPRKLSFRADRRDVHDASFYFAAARRAAQYFFIRRLTARFCATDIFRRLRVALVLVPTGRRPRRVAVDAGNHENGDGTPSDFIALTIRA